MRWILFTMLLSSCASASIVEDVPVEFQGYWVSFAENCNATSGLVIERNFLILKNAVEEQAYRDIDICHSCVGGAKSEGIEIWLIPEFTTRRPSPFIVRLNADKLKGIVQLQLRDDNLRKKFPLLDNVLLKNCKNETSR